MKKKVIKFRNLKNVEIIKIEKNFVNSFMSSHMFLNPTKETNDFLV